MNKGNGNVLKNVGVLLLMLLIIVGLSAIAFTGIDMVIFEIPSVQDGVKLGLDLRGGSMITYEIQAESATQDQINSVISMLRQRVDAEGLYDTTIYESGHLRITLEIPDMDNPDEAVKMIGSTAKLEFRDFENKVWLTGDAVAKAEAAYGDATNSGTAQYYVSMSFREDAEATWAEATKYAANQESGSNYIALYMDGEPVTDPQGNPFQPTVGSEFASTGIQGDCVVTFGTSRTSSDSANSFANLVNIGQLPFELAPAQLSSVGPTLGATSLDTSLSAALIGLIIIVLFMIVVYRLPGVIAAISLAFYTALVAVVLAVVGSTAGISLSLPGIAGIILSIGMAVDANVVIYERIKEELRSGKTIRSAVDAGFKRALTAIIDSNITTVIAAVVLGIFGTGTIRGFAVTLGIGVAVSMFTVLVVSRMLLRQMVSLGLTGLWLYGVSENNTPFFERTKLSVIRNFPKFGIASGIICLFSLVCLILLAFGVSLFNLDIDFVGGVSVHYETHQALGDGDMSVFSDALHSVTGEYPSAPQRKDETQVIVKTTAFSADQRIEALEVLKATFPEIEVLETQEVGSSVGRDLQRAAVASVVVSAALMLLYITMRFQFSSGLAAVIALLHDIFIILAGYVIFQIPINMNFIAVMLTILGYSINSTIIVFDRIRENRRLMTKSNFIDIADKSIKQTMFRNINTSLTTLMPIICLIILGVPSIRTFAIPLAIGIVAGAYSSIFLSGSFWHKIRKAER